MKPILFALIFVAGGILMEKIGIEAHAVYSFFGYVVGVSHACAIRSGK